MKYNGVWPPAIDTFGLQNRWPVPFHQAGIIDAEMNLTDKSIFLCPSEKAPRAIPNWGTSGATVDRVEVGGSYALNEEIHRNGDKLERGYFPPPYAVPPFLAKIDNCTRASEVFAVMGNAWPLQTVSSRGWRFHRGYTPGDSETNNRNGSFYMGYRNYDGTPAEPSRVWQYKRIIGARHSGKGNGLLIDTHVESYRPEKVRYNQVSWRRWAEESPPPGGQ